MKKIILIGIVFLLMAGCSSVKEIEIDVIDVNITNTIHDGTTLITENYLYSVASGEVNGAVIWNKFGFNDDIDTATDPEIIASWGGDNSIFLSTAEKLNISSTSSTDKLGDTGAQSVLIYGIDSTRTALQELVFLNGSNVVQTTNSFLGVNRMVIYLGGSDQRNDGDITASSSSTDKIQAQIPAGLGTSQQSFFFIEANHTFLNNYLVFNANKLAGGVSPKLTIIGWSRSYVSNAEYEIMRNIIDTSVENTIQLTPLTPFVLGEKSILYFTAETDTNNAQVSVRFSGIEKEID